MSSTSLESLAETAEEEVREVSDAAGYNDSNEIVVETHEPKYREKLYFDDVEEDVKEVISEVTDVEKVEQDGRTMSFYL
jgi:hypothetical protein